MDSRDTFPDLIVHERPEARVRDLRLTHAWFCNLDREESDAGALSVLPAAERARATRFKRDMDRRRYVARRAFVRRVLANLQERPAEKLEFAMGRCGKPVLVREADTEEDGGRSLEFSASHSQNMLGIVVTAGREIGLDLEVVRPIPDVLDVAATLLPASSLSTLASRSGTDRDSLFYRLWTRNEAFAKLQGRGIDCRHAHERPRIERWTVRSLSFRRDGQRVVGTLALEILPHCGSAGESRGRLTPSGLPSPSGGAPCSRTSGSA